MQTAIERYDRLLAAGRLKRTRARRAVFDVLVASSRPMAAVEIVGRVVGVNQSSVYRALRALAAAGVVHEVPRGFKTFYELGEEFCGHHHHVVCRVCGRTVAVSDERIEAMVTELTVGAGMVPVAHYIELYGVCRECRRRGLG